MINLHNLASRAIGALHGHERVTLIQSTGQVNEAGRVFAKYAEPIQLFAQIQSMGSDELAHFEKTDSTKIYRKAWLNEPARPIAGIDRELARNGDFIKRADGSWWLVTAVIDDFSRAGWVSVAITEQLDGPASYPAGSSEKDADK